MRFDSSLGDQLIDNKSDLLYNRVLVRRLAMKQRKQALPRERNQFVAAALFRKAGAHRKPNKALRKQENQKFNSMERLT